MKVDKYNKYIEIDSLDGGHKYPICDFSPDFLDWFLEDRQLIFRDISRKDIIPSFSSHLPVVTTLNRNGDAFPFHTSTKGVGLLPKENYLEHYCQLFSGLLERKKGESRETIKKQRVKAIQEFYCSNHIAPNRLGLLEIFRGNSFQNIQANPQVSLHFTSPGPQYKSFQLNGIMEIIESSDLNFQFIYLARMLFEHESFHIRQPEYRTGYLFWVCEVYDKAPIRGRAGKRLR